MEAFRQAIHILPPNRSSVNDLAYAISGTLEQLDFQIRFLSGLVFRLAQESGIAENSGIRMLFKKPKRNLLEPVNTLFLLI